MSDSSTRTLIPGQRSLIGHLVGSSTGAANDNFFRIAFTAAVQVLAPDDAEQLKPLLGLLFIIPMLLLAPTAGSLGDRLRPRGIMLWVRGMELPLVVLGGVALWLGSIPLMMLTLAGFGLQTAFFSPVKYGCLPDIVDSKHLAQGNGALQAATSLAILVGTALVFLLDPNIRAGTWLSDWDQGLILGLLGGCLAMVGVIATWMIRPIPAHNPTTKIATPFDIPKQFRSLSQQAGLWGPTLALAAFWALGSVGQLVIIGVTMGTFGFKEGGVAVLSLLLGLGSIIGGLSAGRILVDSAPRALAVSGAFIAGGGFAMAC